MLSSIIDAFKVPELRKKILFTLAILALYRFGAYVPVPGIPFNEFANSFQDSGVSMTMLDLFTGGALSNFSVFSLGIMPYITASIIMQLMQGVIPAVGRWAKEGDAGRKKITQVTRYLTLGLGLINAVGYLFLFKSPAYGVVFSTEVPELLTDFIADATRKLAEIGGEIPTPSLPTSAHARVAETTVEATGRVMTSPAQAPINVDGTAAYAMPQTGAVSVAPATPTPSRVEKDLSGFGDADDAFEFEEID